MRLKAWLLVLKPVQGKVRHDLNIFLFVTFSVSICHMLVQEREMRMKEGVVGLVVPPVTPLLTIWTSKRDIGKIVRG